ncbi:hypothetical protein QTP86_034535 [Hemibagrus guttatus]|nr:hypothetical protein QTP86_034535 [Hemibagrus guttatus]
MLQFNTLSVFLCVMGLYYCSFSERMIFSNSTYLQVKGQKKALCENQDGAKDAVLFMLIVVFGAVIVFLLSVLIFIILKHRKTHRGDDTEAQVKDQEKKKIDTPPVLLMLK